VAEVVEVRTVVGAVEDTGETEVSTYDPYLLTPADVGTASAHHAKH
jgi:hypothetical protein